MGTEATLDEFQANVQSKRNKFNTIVNWHLEAFTQADIPLPYGADSLYCYMTVEIKDVETGNYSIDEKATIENLSKVVKFARSKGLKVEKEYNSDFEVVVHIADNARIHYIANRDAVCEKKVVGTKVIPAEVTPERIEEVIEWDCKKVSLLAQD